METVQEVLESIQKKGKSPNRFSKKNYNRLVKAMLNDVEFKAKVAKVSGDELLKVEDVAVSAGFRGFLKKVLEKAGMDKNDSAVVLSSAFTIDNVDGLYEFFAESIWQYLNAGNMFDLPNKEDFKGSLYLKEVAAGSREGSVRNPRTKEDMGRYEFSHKEYKTLAVSSPCPKYLKSKRPL